MLVVVKNVLVCVSAKPRDMNSKPKFDEAIVSLHQKTAPECRSQFFLLIDQVDPFDMTVLPLLAGIEMEESKIESASKALKRGRIVLHIQVPLILGFQTVILKGERKEIQYLSEKVKD